jgi:hypothetical protein
MKCRYLHQKMLCVLPLGYQIFVDDCNNICLLKMEIFLIHMQRTFPSLTFKFQSPERRNFVAADRLEGLIVELVGFRVTKMSEPISPLAEKVLRRAIEEVDPVVFPLVLVLSEVAMFVVSFV